MKMWLPVVLEVNDDGHGGDRGGYERAESGGNEERKWEG